MKLIFISDNGSHHKKINLGWKQITLLLFSTGLFLALIYSSFYYLKLNRVKKDAISGSEIKLLNKFDILLLKAAKLEAQVKRLNSLGKIIAEKNNVDIEAYLLEQKPALGGLDETSIDAVGKPIRIITQDKLLNSINDLEMELELQQQRFDIMNIAHPTTKIKTPSLSPKKLRPLNRNYSSPVASGYVSSNFGSRRDPINGHQRHHNGIDIAAKHGSKIHTIASGFVTFSGRKGGYGKVIDIHHSDTLKSRYAHLDSIKVKKGDVVRKGEIIATMGQTGRATGSHLHLEVWKKNRPVNPKSYIDTALIK